MTISFRGLIVTLFLVTLILLIVDALFNIIPAPQQFNPATDDCTELEACANYNGEKGVLEINEAPYISMCRYDRQKTGISINTESRFVKGLSEKKCVSWQLKKENFYSQEYDVKIYATNGEETKTLQTNESYKAIVTPKQDCSPQMGESSKVKINGGVISNEECQYCRDNPSDTEQCECVKKERRGSNESTYDCWTINLNYPENDVKRYNERDYSRTYIYNGTTIITDNVDGRDKVKEICELQDVFLPIREFCVEAVPR